MSEINQDYQIDLEKVLADKFKGKKFPRFAVSWLKNFIHQDFINELLAGGSEGAPFCDHVLEHMNVTVDVKGLENVPKDGVPYTFASNHPLGGIDGIALCSIINNNYGSMKMLVNDFLMFVKPLAPLCVPINKIGRQARNLPTLVDDAFRSEDNMLIFPAGLCSRRIGGSFQDIPWTKTFIKKSVETGRAVVPVHFIGRNSSRFYNVAGFCKTFGLKTNFAMFFLPDELYKARNSHLEVRFGEPVPADYFDKSRTALEWAAWMRQKVYNL